MPTMRDLMFYLCCSEREARWRSEADELLARDIYAAVKARRVRLHAIRNS